MTIRATVLALSMLTLAYQGSGMAPAHATSMQVVGDQVIMSGPTDLTDYERLKRLLDANEGKITTIVLRNRGGGEATATHRMMYMIRTRGLRTAVSGSCVSACAYTFLGGVERHLAAESLSRQTRVSFHSMFNERLLLKWDMVPRMVEIIADYTGDRIDRTLFHRMIELTAPRDVLTFEPLKPAAPATAPSVYLCKGAFVKYREDCEAIRGTDGYEQGIFTSRQLIKINTMIELAGDQLIVSGDIDRADMERIRYALDANGKLTTVVLQDSSGNDAEVGDALAHLIRERGLRTAVSGYCTAACARAFLGGVERRITDRKPHGQSYIALPGDPAAGALEATLLFYTEGKATASVVGRLGELTGSESLVFFLDPIRAKGHGGASIFLCHGGESRRVTDCERIMGTSSHEQGIFTSPDLLRLNTPDS